MAGGKGRAWLARDVHDTPIWALSDDLDPDCFDVGTNGGVHLVFTPRPNPCKLTRVAKKEGVSQLTIIAVSRSVLHSLEGTQTLFAHLAPVPTAFYHGLASSLEPALNSGDTELV